MQRLSGSSYRQRTKLWPAPGSRHRRSDAAQLSKKAAVAKNSSTDVKLVPSFLAYVVGTLIAWLLCFGHWSWRKDVGEGERIDEMLADGRRLLAVFWHGKYFPLFSLLAGRNACIFTTPCFRGEVVAEICRRFGYECYSVPAVGGKSARAAMYDVLSTRNAAAFAVDGPLGPNHRIKRGALDIAADLGFSLLPVSASARHRQVLHRRWDRREIPLPFTRVALTVGEPITISSPRAGRDIPHLKRQLHDALQVLGQRAEDKVGLSATTISRRDFLAPTVNKREGGRP